MKNSTFRAIAYSSIGLLALAATRMDPPEATSPAARLAGEMVVAEFEAPIWQHRQDTLARGETLSALFIRAGLTGGHAAQALRAATTSKLLDERRVPAGLPVTVSAMSDDSLPSEVVLQMAIDRVVRLQRIGESWVGVEEVLPWTMDTMVVSGRISTNLYNAVDAGAGSQLPAGARIELTNNLADIYEYRVNMSRDLQVGDSFRVLFERGVAPNGAVKIGRVLAARMELSGTTTEAFRFETTADGNYFDQNGKAMKSGFLQAPLQFRRISSVYGGRRHPILKTWRQHTGVDYAASSGTPVRTIGDGTVVFAGVRGGYGNLVEIRHRNGYVTRYAHLRRFGSGVRKGNRVTMGQTIGFVGMTGMATGPHLHFEVLVGGSHRDPRVALRNVQSGEPIPASDRARFDAMRETMVAELERSARPFRLAPL